MGATDTNTLIRAALDDVGRGGQLAARRRVTANPGDERWVAAIVNPLDRGHHVITVALVDLGPDDELAAVSFPFRDLTVERAGIPDTAAEALFAAQAQLVEDDERLAGRPRCAGSGQPLTGTMAVMFGYGRCAVCDQMVDCDHDGRTRVHATAGAR